jgi:hypothetical protein
LAKSRCYANQGLPRKKLTVEPDLQAVASAFADLTDSELTALIDAITSVPQIAPELLTWMGGACDWELNRRRGVQGPLQRPPAAALAAEDAIDIHPIITIPRLFSQRARSVHALFDALADLLIGGGHKL